MVQHETMDIFIAGEGNYTIGLTRGGGLEEREFFIGDATFLASVISVHLVTFMIGLGLYCIGCVVEEFSTQLVSKLGTCLLTIARCCIMGGILVFQLLL